MIYRRLYNNNNRLIAELLASTAARFNISKYRSFLCVCVRVGRKEGGGRIFNTRTGSSKRDEGRRERNGTGIPIFGKEDAVGHIPKTSGPKMLMSSGIPAMETWVGGFGERRNVRREECRSEK